MANYLPENSAKSTASLVIDECDRLYGGRPGDDTTIAVARVRNRHTVNLIVGPPENKEDYKAYDIYRKLDGKEKKAMQENIEKYSVKFSAGLDERVLPAMPKTKKATVQGKRNFLKIIAERQARLQAQIDWLHSEQEKYRKLRDET